MPRVPIPSRRISRWSPLTSENDGFVGVDSDPDNGHSFRNSVGRTIIYATSDAADARPLNFKVAAKVDGLPVEDLTVWVPAGEGLFVGPFPRSYTQSDGTVYVDVPGDAGDIALLALRI